MHGRQFKHKHKEADYILLIDTHWELQSTSGENELYRAVSTITLHDAATGRLVMELGNQTDSYSGMVMVTSKKSYKSIDINKILSPGRRKAVLMNCMKSPKQKKEEAS